MEEGPLSAKNAESMALTILLAGYGVDPLKDLRESTDNIRPAAMANYLPVRL